MIRPKTLYRTVGLYSLKAVQRTTHRCFGLPRDIGPTQAVQMCPCIAVEGEIRQGVVDQHIRGAEAFGDLIHHRPDLFQACHIRLERARHGGPSSVASASAAA